MFAVYEFEFFEDDGLIVAVPFDLEGGTQGSSWEEASRMAADWLLGEAEHALMARLTMPAATFNNTPVHGGRVGVVAVQASLDAIDAVSASEAARLLGVSRGRVSQMLKSGLLEGYSKGRSTFVTRASIDARIAENPGPGRPRKCNVDAALA